MKVSRMLSLLLCLLLVFSMFAGCQAPSEEPADTAPPAAEDNSQVEDTPPDPPASDVPVSGEREITDMAGRAVTVPAEVSGAFSTGAVGTIMLYTLDPALMTGVNYMFNEAEAAFILPEYRDLPEYGQGGGLNLEAVIASAPDVLIICDALNETTIGDTDALQDQAGIPCIMLDSSMAAIPAAYRLLGELLGRPDEAETLAVYSEEALAFAESVDIPEEERAKVYFGNGLESLDTAPVGSPHAELFELVDVTNVAVTEEEVTSRIEISPEQIIGWNPQAVILNGEPTENLPPIAAVEAFMEDPNYANVAAVESGDVYAIPKYPFGWFDRPPGANRLIGIYWLSGLFYGDTFDIDIKAEAREFYELFYHMELTDEQLVELLGF